MKVTIETTFSAIHSLPKHSPCSKMHGHSYRVRAVIDGPVKDGMVVDFGRARHALRLWNHEILNFVKEEGRDVKIEYYQAHKQEVLRVPTVENLVLFFIEELTKLGRFETVEVTVWETEDCSATAKMLGVNR